MDDQQIPPPVQQPSQPANPNGELNAPAAQPAPPKPKKPSKWIVVGVVLFFIALAAVTIFVIRRDDTKTNATNPATNSQGPATSSDVDQTAKDIDATLQNAENVNDVNSADLTDSSLGL